VLTNGMRIVIGWAGSAQSLASDPFRYVVLDEAAKYRWTVQGEGSPIDLARERVKVFGRRGKIVLLSSPKSDDDVIVTHHAQVEDRRVFAVPCSACARVQPIDFAAVRWPGGDPSTAPSDASSRVRLADAIEGAQSAWVECSGCGGKVHPHRAMRDERATWVQEKTAPRSRRVAFHVPEFFHWETTLSALAAKWLRCTTARALQGFHNGSLGLPYKSERGGLAPAMFQRKAVHPDGLVPAWATTVLATADTQADHFWLTVRAHGPGGKSRGLDWGRVDSFEELRARALERRWPVEGGGAAFSRLLLIDSGGGMETPDGSRTHAVYQFALDTPHVLACKGEADLEVYKSSPYRKSKVTYSPDAGEDYEVDLVLLHVEYWKDTAATLIRSDAWEEPSSAAAAEYGKQMTAEHKVMHTLPNGETYWRWSKRAKHGAEHLWDCAWMQAAAAALARVDGEAPIPERIEKRRRAKAAAKSNKGRKRATTPDGRPFHVGSR
jgi:phage terminase large subunit GpA-like protein